MSAGQEEYTSVAGPELYSHREMSLGGFRFFSLCAEGTFRVFQQIAKIQGVALRNLYERVKLVADGMNGTCTEMELPNPLPDQMSDGASDLCVVALHVELPGGLVVDFKPQNALGIGSAVSVNARRILPGSGTLSDRGFSFIDGYWQSGGKALSDDEIRDCLTLRGPVPIY